MNSVLLLESYHNELQRRIESKKQELIQSYKEHGISHDETIRLSRELDQYLNEYQGVFDKRWVATNACRLSKYFT